MSWLFGILRKNNSPFPKFELNEEFQKVHKEDLFIAISNKTNTSLENSIITYRLLLECQSRTFLGKEKYYLF